VGEDHCLFFPRALLVLHVENTNREGSNYLDVSDAFGQRRGDEHGACGDNARDEEDGAEGAFLEVVLPFVEVGYPGS